MLKGKGEPTMMVPTRPVRQHAPERSVDRYGGRGDPAAG